jgi:hypothetical protein
VVTQVRPIRTPTIYPFADYITSSGVDSIIGVSGPTLPGTVGIPVPLQTGWDGHSRAFDAELKLYSTMASRFVN